MAGQGEEKPMVTTTGYWYSDASANMANQMQESSFEQNNPSAEIYNLTNPGGGGGGMEMIGWKSFLNKGAAGSSSKTLLSSEPFYHQNFSTTMGGGGAWVADDEVGASLRCVFPCEGNERPSQGLSLSLNSSNPSAIGLQSFELRAAPVMHGAGFFGKSAAAANLNHPSYTGYFQMRNSKYLGAAQELLNEFCFLGTYPSKIKNTNQWHPAEAPSLDSIDILELHKKKTKLLQMLEEVDRRYKKYCDEMRAVVWCLDGVAGKGAAKVYIGLAAKAMSRHFRSLRDGIVGQIRAMKKAAREKECGGGGGGGTTTKGETPRLKMVDQALRQQRAFQQMSMMESHPWRPQRGLPERSVSVLRAWLFEHFLHPYPSDVDKHILARQTGLSRSQVSNWFINARVRLWKPMVEEMYLEETKEEENLVIANSSADNGESGDQLLQNHYHNPTTDTEDHKPNLVRIDSECICSIVNNPSTAADNNDQRPKLIRDVDHHHHHSFDGPVGLDFSPPPPPYTHNSGGGAFSYGGGVSLTLGLQQQGGSGMGLAAAFSSAPSQASSSSLYYPRDQMDDCQTVPYPLLDNDGQNLPYRNLIGAQLLHDLAG